MSTEGLDDDRLASPTLESIPPARVGGGLTGSFRAALQGVLRTIASQRNMKIHVVAGELVMIVGMALPLDLATRVAMLFAVAIVFFAEILNTALEAFVDLHIRKYHRLAGMAKDAAAAGVLVLAVTTVLVLCEILWTQWPLVTGNLDAVERSVLFGVPLAVVEIVGISFVRRGPLFYLRLGVALALATPLVLHTTDPIFAAVLVMLILVAAIARFSFPQLTGRGAPRA